MVRQRSRGKLTCRERITLLLDDDSFHEVGSAVTDFKPGDRVITYNFTTCGNCLLCRTNRAQLCPNMTDTLGVRGRPGSHAEFLKIPAAQVVVLRRAFGTTKEEGRGLNVPRL